MTASTSLRAPRRAIDIHAHLTVPEVYAITLPHSLIAIPIDSATPQREDVRRSNAERRRAMDERMSDTTARIQHMDRAGIAVQVLTASLVHQATDMLPLEESLRLERLKNDSMSAVVRSAPSRYIGLGGVPLQEPKLAVAELERCVGELGLVGVQISTFYAGRDLGARENAGFWAKAEEIGARIYVHPSGSRDPRLRLHSQWNSIGQSYEEAMAISSLMYEGVIDRHPALRICISHGGGYMPFNFARQTRNWLEKPATRINMSRTPADFLRMLWYDSCVYDPCLLAQLVDVVGEDRVILGSDYPVGDPDPLALVEASALPSSAREAIAWRNARAFFGLAT